VRPSLHCCSAMLKLATYIDPPYVTDCFERAFTKGGCPLPGIEIEFLATLLTMLRLPYSLSAIESSEVTAAVANVTIDLPGTTMQLTPELQASFHLTSPVVVDRAVLVIQKQLKMTVRSSFFASADWKT
jgi:hypothetical protein